MANQQNITRANDDVIADKKDLIRICGMLSAKGRNRLMMAAYQLEELEDRRHAKPGKLVLMKETSEY